MKRLFRLYIFDTLSLYLASLVAAGLVFENGGQTLLLSGIVLTATSIVARPILNLLLLPLNLITFGFFKWVSSVAALYIVTLIVPGFKILHFNFSGFSSVWIDIPSFFLSGIMSFIAFSFTVSIISSAIQWLSK